MSENVLVEARLTKLEYVKDITNPYPERFERTHELYEVGDLLDDVDGIRVAGRIMSMRKMGKLSFLTIADIEGKMQIAVKKDVVGEEAYEFVLRVFTGNDQQRGIYVRPDQLRPALASGS